MVVESKNAQKNPNAIRKAILIVFGTIALGLGILGIILPVLPTTPFLLLAAASYMSSSQRLYNWLINHPKLGVHIERFKRERSMTLRAKVTVLALAWIMLVAAAIFLVKSPFMKVFLIGLAVTKTVVLSRIKTHNERSALENTNR